MVEIKFAIAIVFYEPDETVVRRMERYSSQFEKCLILDNSSKSNKSRVAHIANVDYCWFKGNVGLSIALEQAYRWGYKNEIDYLLTMDQDTEYSETDIKNMKLFITEHLGYAIYCTNWSKMYWDKKLKKIKISKTAIPQNETKRVINCMTSGSWAEIKTIMEILPLQNLFIGYVDTDISYRLYQKGHAMICIGNSCIEQQIGKKVKGTFLNMLLKKILHSKERYYYMSRNNLYLQKKFKDDRKLIKSLVLNRVRIFLNIIIFEDKKLEKLQYWMMGIKAYKENKYGAM